MTTQARSHPEAMKATPSNSHAMRYQGKNLLLLLVAIGTPAALLYLRLVLGYVGSEAQLTAAGSERLIWASNLTLVLFFLAQPIAARYVQRLLKPAATVPRRALQYLGVLLLCVLLSVTGAVLLEAFGYAFFLRMKHSR